MTTGPATLARPGALAGLGVAALIVAGLFAMDSKAGEINITDGAAIQGYDPVAYFRERKPVLGNPALTVTYKDAQFRFSSEQNRAAFAANPEKYAPQYGGFCAYGTAKGYKAPIDPAAFTLSGGKLYLNYNKDVQQTWRADQPGYIATGDRNWPTVKTQ